MCSLLAQINSIHVQPQPPSPHAVGSSNCITRAADQHHTQFMFNGEPARGRREILSSQSSSSVLSFCHRTYLIYHHHHHPHPPPLDRSDGQFFKAMEWRWLFFSNDGMAMEWRSPSMVPGRINHWQRWFFNGFFSNFRDQCFTMVTN